MSGASILQAVAAEFADCTAPAGLDSQLVHTGILQWCASLHVSLPHQYGAQPVALTRLEIITVSTRASVYLCVEHHLILQASCDHERLLAPSNVTTHDMNMWQKYSGEERADLGMTPSLSCAKFVFRYFSLQLAAFWGLRICRQEIREWVEAAQERLYRENWAFRNIDRRWHN